MDDDPSGTHRIADSVLRIAVDGDFGAAEICTESITRYTVDIDTFAAHTGSNESLTETSDYSAIAVRFPDLFVKFGKSEPFRINYHYYTTPPSFFLRYSALNANKFGTFFRLSKSISETGTRLRITEV